MLHIHLTRFMAVLATLIALQTNAIAAGSPSELAVIDQSQFGRRALAARHASSRTRELLGSGRRIKAGRMIRRSLGQISRRRKEDEDEDRDDEGAGSASAAKSFLTSDDLDAAYDREHESRYSTSDQLGSRSAAASPDDNDDALDTVEETPGGDIQVKPAQVDSSSAATLLRGAASTELANPKGRLASSLSTGASVSSLAASSSPITSASSAPIRTTLSSSPVVTVTESPAVSSPSPSTSPVLVTSTVTADESTPSPTSSLPSSTSASGDASSATNSTPTSTATPSSVPFTSIWSAYKTGSKWFPVAIILTILIAIAALVIAVALLQCIARSSRFSKKAQAKERPLLIPQDSTWHGSETSRRSSLLSVAEKSGGAGLASVPASRAGSTMGGVRHAGLQYSRATTPALEVYTAFPSSPSRPSGPGRRASASAMFQPQSYDADPVTADLEDVYPALSRRAYSQVSVARSHSPSLAGAPSRRNTPAPAPAVWPYPETVPAIQRMAPAAYPYSSPQTAYGGEPRTPHAPRLPSLQHIPRIGTPSALTPGRPSSPAAPMQHFLRHAPTPAPDHHFQYQYQNNNAAGSVCSSRFATSQYGPRPGRTEQQSVVRSSLNEDMLHQQLMGRRMLPSTQGSRYLDEAPRLPVGVMERRRWERCST